MGMLDSGAIKNKSNQKVMVPLGAKGNVCRDSTTEPRVSDLSTNVMYCMLSNEHCHSSCCILAVHEFTCGISYNHELSFVVQVFFIVSIQTLNAFLVRSILYAYACSSLKIFLICTVCLVQTR